MNILFFQLLTHADILVLGVLLLRDNGHHDDDLLEQRLQVDLGYVRDLELGPVLEHLVHACGEQLVDLYDVPEKVGHFGRVGWSELFAQLYDDPQSHKSIVLAVNLEHACM